MLDLAQQRGPGVPVLPDGLLLYPDCGEIGGEVPLKNGLECGGHPESSESYLPIRAEIFHQPYSLHTGASTCPLLGALPKGTRQEQK